MEDFSIINDSELIKHLQKGDEHAFTEIYNRYWEKVLAIAYYHTQDKQDAEDIVHDVLTGLWSRKNNIDIQSLNAYLATAVKFAVFKFIARNKKRKDILAGQYTQKHFSDIEQKLEAKFLQEYLHGVVEELPEKARLVFDYSRKKNFSITEIADKMDLSPKAVEYHITKALRKLKEALRKIKLFFL